MCAHNSALRPFLWHCERQKCVYTVHGCFLFVSFFFFSGFIFIFSIFDYFFHISNPFNFITFFFLFNEMLAKLRRSSKKVIIANFNDNNLWIISINSFKMHQIEKLIHYYNTLLLVWMWNGSTADTAICSIDRKIICYWSDFDVE